MSDDLKKPSAEATETLVALRRAVKNTLDRKQRLGQFAVVWRDGEPALLDDAAEDHALFFEALQRVTRPQQSGVADTKGAYRRCNK